MLRYWESISSIQMKKTIGDQLENLPSGLSMRLKLSVKANRGPVLGEINPSISKRAQSEGFWGGIFFARYRRVKKISYFFFFWKHSDNRDNMGFVIIITSRGRQNATRDVER